MDPSVDTSPPVNFFLEAQTEGHTLWRDSRGRSNLWPGEATLLSIVAYNNPDELDVALLNVFARMVSLLPFEVTLRPKFKHFGTPGHTSCYELPGSLDLIEEYTFLEDYNDRAVPLRGLRAAYCPCGFRAHWKAFPLSQPGKVSSTHHHADEMTVHAALSGNLAFLADHIHTLFRDKHNDLFSPDSGARGNLCNLYVGLILGGHRKNQIIERLMPLAFHGPIWQVRAKVPPGSRPVACLQANSITLQAAIMAGDDSLVKDWLDRTQEPHHDVIQSLVERGASEGGTSLRSC